MKRSSFAIAALLLVTTPSRAQPRDPIAAEAIFQDARKDVERGDLTAACPKFAESLRLDPAPGTLINLADCEEKIGQLANAWQHLRQLADRTADGDPRKQVILDRVKALDPRVPRLIIAAPEKADPELKVSRDGVELGRAAFGVPIPANPGAHQILVRLPGHVTRRFVVTLLEGRTETVKAEPGPLEGNDEAPAEEPKPGNPRTKRMAGFVIGGLGVVAIGAGAAFGVSALSKKNESADLCPQDRCTSQEGIAAFDAAKSRAKVADMLLVTGVLVVGIGAFLVLTSHDEPTAATSTASRLLRGEW